MENVKLTFVNVGYGEAMVLECPAPERPGGVFVMVIDGGSAEAAEYADRSSGRLTLAEYLEKRALDHIDCMVATHIHEDHTCGLLPVAEKWPPKELWQTLPEDFYRTSMHLLEPEKAETASQSKFLRALNDYQALCALVEQHGGRICRLTAGAKGTLASDVSWQVLAPMDIKAAELEACCRELFQETEPHAFLKKLAALDGRMNNFSMILRLECRGIRALLPGDTNCTGYADIPTEELRADVFKVGHHGQKDGAAPELLAAIQPKMVVCCASSDRRYESAHPNTMAMVVEAGGKLYFSDCPQVESSIGTAAPHQALEFAVDEQGGLSARYLTTV